MDEALVVTLGPQQSWLYQRDTIIIHGDYGNIVLAVAIDIPVECGDMLPRRVLRRSGSYGIWFS
jgi:hypothetical protein